MPRAGSTRVGRSLVGRSGLVVSGSHIGTPARRRAFTEDSQASLIAAMLERDPEPLASIQPVVPPGLDRLVRKCLAAGEPLAKDAYVFGDELGRRVKSVRTAWENACDALG